MCSYCGCRAITMIGRLSTEHVEIINATGVLRRVALDGDGDATDTAVVELAALLDPHTTAEEQGLFAELRLDEDFAGHVDALCAEHREIDARLAQVAGGDHAEVERAREPAAPPYRQGGERHLPGRRRRPRWGGLGPHPTARTLTLRHPRRRHPGP